MSPLPTPSRSLRLLLRLLAACTAGLLLSSSAEAVPAFARQTGQDCVACHVGGFGPQLTPFGRAFKLSGYTLGSDQNSLPLSAMLVASYTHNNVDNAAPPAGFHANDNVALLQQASVFLAGRVTDHIGALAQVTYASPGSDRITWDNTDVRYASDFKLGSVDGIIGVSVNNNPTVSDVWNTVPAWQFGFMTSPFGAGVPATPMIASLGASALGTTVYTLLDNHWYAEVGLYHPISSWWAQQLQATPNALVGFNPYWRLNYSDTAGDNNYMVGLIGMNSKVTDGNTGLNDSYRDVGIDGSYQYIDADTATVTVNALYMHEHQDYSAGFNGSTSSNPTDTLNYANVNVAYWYHNTYGATIQLFNTSGSTDATLYTSGANNPGSSGVVWELDWNPFGKSWTNPEKNLRLGLQYTTYNKFMGTSTNASDNNSIYVYVWTAI